MAGDIYLTDYSGSLVKYNSAINNSMYYYHYISTIATYNKHATIFDSSQHVEPINPGEGRLTVREPFITKRYS